MLGRIGTHGELQHRLTQIVTTGAAQATVAELGHTVLVHVLDQSTIDVDITEFVDDHTETLATIADQVVDQSRFARAEETSDDGHGNAGSKLKHASSLPVPGA
jgi:hypothetical protein